MKETTSQRDWEGLAILQQLRLERWDILVRLVENRPLQLVMGTA